MDVLHKIVLNKNFSYFDSRVDLCCSCVRSADFITRMLSIAPRAHTSMELSGPGKEALLLALNLARANCPTERVSICVDSQSLLKAILGGAQDTQSIRQ